MAKDFEWYSVHNCGYLKGDMKYMGIYPMGWYKSIDFKNAKGMTTKKQYDKSKVIEFKFTPLEECVETEHECVVSTDSNDFKLLQCSTECGV